MTGSTSTFLVVSEADYPVGQVTVVAGEDGLVAILFDPAGVEILAGLSGVEVLGVDDVAATGVDAKDLGAEDVIAEDPKAGNIENAAGTEQSVRSAARAASGHLEQAHRELGEYFAGERTQFDVVLDLATLRRLSAPGSSPFQQTVQRAMTAIPYGETQSYGELAASIGNPGAARAVGSACANNPFPIVVPCHRVVRADGSQGHYTGGKHIKETLLALERVVAQQKQESL